MSNTLIAEQINDLVFGTLKYFDKDKLRQIAQSLQHYEIMSHWMKKEKMQIDSGFKIQRTLMYKTNGAARHVGLHATDNVNIGDHLLNMEIPWVHAQTDWGFEHREVLMNRGKSLVNNVVKPRRIAAMIDMAEILESKAWSAPTVAQTLLPYGIPYWIVKNATTGFNGGLPEDHTTLAGINLSTATNFKNYTDIYTNITKDDFVKKLRTAYRKTGFKSPVSMEAFKGEPGRRYRLYVNEETISQIETIGEQQNENLGKDIASMDDQIVFRKIPFVWVPQLDTDSTNPIYGIDHNSFYMACLKGDVMRESKPMTVPGQHNSSQSFVDLSYNYVCEDRRCNFVMATSAS